MPPPSPEAQEWHRIIRASVRECRDLAPSIQGWPEREALCANLPAYLRDFTRFAYLSGWRRGEVASLTWADVDREAHIIRLRPEASKNGEGRTLALEDELWELIERRWQGREYKTPAGSALAALVFHRKGEPVGDFRKVGDCVRRG